VTVAVRRVAYRDDRRAASVSSDHFSPRGMPHVLVYFLRRTDACVQITTVVHDDCPAEVNCPGTVPG